MKNQDMLTIPEVSRVKKSFTRLGVFKLIIHIVHNRKVNTEF